MQENCISDMKKIVPFSHLILCFLAAPLLLSTASIAEDDHDHGSAEEDVFEYSPGVFNPITGEGANLGGFLYPELFIDLTGGVFEPGTEPSDLATSEHDPQREAGVQAIELSFDINFGDIITGGVTGAGFQLADEWEAALEEAYLHYHVNEHLAVGGGQFLNTFGFQADKHIHGWDFINQNLPNGRLLNEGELITQGGELIAKIPDWNTRVTVGAGGVRTHAHDHAHGGEDDEHGHEDEDEHHEDEDEHHDDEDEDEHHEDEDEHHDEEEGGHLEADDANFVDWVSTFDIKTKLPFDETATISASVASGENGFGRDTTAYGFGIEKIWGAHDHGNGPEFCDGAFLARSEFIGRRVGIEDEMGRRYNGDEYGVSTSVFYGLGESTTLSLRHDWVSDMEELELEDRHRISPALTVYLDNAQRIRARVQYDCNHFDSYGTVHAAWLQFQIQWGGHGGGNHNH